MSEPYRAAPEPRSPDPYLAAWERYEERRTMKWVLALGSPIAAALIVGAIRFHSDDGPLVTYGVLGSIALVAMCWLGVFRCPRCGARMYVRTFRRNPWPDGCRSCGIDVGTPKYREDRGAPSRPA